MNYWLFKSEPSNWSWDDQLKAGKKGEGWDGVRNYQASNNMKKMKLGDYGFFYHSVTDKQIIGIVEAALLAAESPMEVKELVELFNSEELEKETAAKSIRDALDVIGNIRRM